MSFGDYHSTDCRYVFLVLPFLREIVCEWSICFDSELSSPSSHCDAMLIESAIFVDDLF